MLAVFEVFVGCLLHNNSFLVRVRLIISRTRPCSKYSKILPHICNTLQMILNNRCFSVVIGSILSHGTACRLAAK